ncbi:hypothetical protein BaRGS_00008381 [Batillaria attramentaria]|uniref:Uncharacterized protein n=1 Tax=Batillaria attramentaria TaxID=370345 RepID=A0ABD0LM49_9CAEN
MYTQMKTLKANLPKTWATATIDFAESYLCHYQDEMQSMHWGYSQVTTHPVALNYQPSQCQNSKFLDNWAVIKLAAGEPHDAHGEDRAWEDAPAATSEAHRQQYFQPQACTTYKALEVGVQKNKTRMVSFPRPTQLPWMVLEVGGTVDKDAASARERSTPSITPGNNR